MFSESLLLLGESNHMINSFSTPVTVFVLTTTLNKIKELFFSTVTMSTPVTYYNLAGKQAGLLVLCVLCKHRKLRATLQENHPAPGRPDVINSLLFLTLENWT